MKAKVLILLMIGVWLGMLIGISFLEAPLKFKAPNMTLTLGLGVGQLVFAALNKVEVLFSVLLFFWLTLHFRMLDILFLALCCLLMLTIAYQSIWLLPILGARVDALLQGGEVAKSHHHLYYVAMEILKVGLLLTIFIKLHNHE